MKANYWQKGDVLDYKNAGSSKIEAGAVVSLTTRIGVAGIDIAVGEVGTLHVVGVFEMPKGTSEAITLGAALYYDATNNKLTATTTNNVLAGYAVAAAAAADATVLVKLQG